MWRVSDKWDLQNGSSGNPDAIYKYITYIYYNRIIKRMLQYPVGRNRNKKRK